MSTDVPVCTSVAANQTTSPPLPSDVPTLHAMILELLSALKKEQHEREGLQNRLDQVLRRLYGPKAERFDPNQPWLTPEMANGDVDPPTPPATVEEESDAAPSAKPKCPGHGRIKLPTDLPRQRKE